MGRAVPPAVPPSPPTQSARDGSAERRGGANHPGKETVMLHTLVVALIRYGIMHHLPSAIAVPLMVRDGVRMYRARTAR